MDHRQVDHYGAGMAEELVHRRVEDGVATITLDSPHNRNALSAQLVAEVTARLGEAGADPAVRAVVLTHTGRVFCSGADLAAAAEGPGKSDTASPADGPNAR